MRTTIEVDSTMSQTDFRQKTVGYESYQAIALYAGLTKMMQSLKEEIMNHDSSTESWFNRAVSNCLEQANFEKFNKFDIGE